MIIGIIPNISVILYILLLKPILLTKKLLIVARPTEVLWGPIFLTSMNLIIVVKISLLKESVYTFFFYINI